MTPPRRLVILGAGRPGDRGPQASLRGFGREHRCVLEWQLETFRDAVDEVEFIGGYEIERVIARFPELTYRFNERWESTGAIDSLHRALAKHREPCDLYVIYGDILLRPTVLDRLRTTHPDKLATVIGPAGLTQGRLAAGRVPESIDTTAGNAEFIGLLRVPVPVYDRFREFVLAEHGDSERAGLSKLVQRWIDVAGGDMLALVDAGCDWAHLEDQTSIAKFILGTKAETLARLRSRLRRSTVPPHLVVTRGAWHARRDDLVREIFSSLGEVKLAVRSSTTTEDSFLRSNAGRYCSRLDVAPESAGVAAAINAVLASYDTQATHDQVLIQPMIARVAASGVVFSRQLGSGAPYYGIEYSVGGDTTITTAGKRGDSNYWTIMRNAPVAALERLPSFLRQLLEAVAEVEDVLAYEQLDIEFAIDEDGVIFTLQARPLFVFDDAPYVDSDMQVGRIVDSVARTLTELSGRRCGQVGEGCMWSIMSDWNPAEIIGPRPGPLAFDLYRYIITDALWARARAEAGYRVLSDWPLVRCFAGQPYVDVRATLNSFVPASLSDESAGRIVEHSLARLRSDPALHDKIEFDVIATCFDFKLAGTCSSLVAQNVLTPAEAGAYRDGLIDITAGIIRRVPDDLAAVHALERNFSLVFAHTGPALDRVRYLLQHCRDYGALHFAHLARGGFVARAMLESAVEREILSRDRVEALRRSLKTVGSLMAEDAWRVRCRELTRADFVRRYGHLRPGTYDVLSPTYASCPQLYLDPQIARAMAPGAHDFSFTPIESACIERSLAADGMSLGADAFLDFVRQAVFGREFAKFVFSRYLSAAMELICEEVQRLGVAAALTDSLALTQLLEGALSVWSDDSLREGLRREAEARHIRHAFMSKIPLPPVITLPEEVYAFEAMASIPNFITDNRGEGELVIVNDALIDGERLRDRIVAIENADPGFDFLFSLGICGLVTAYGGPNSHMAIRAAEFDLPAVIGIGAVAFARLRSGELIELDCRKRQLYQAGTRLEGLR